MPLAEEQAETFGIDISRVVVEPALLVGKLGLGIHRDDGGMDGVPAQNRSCSVLNCKLVHHVLPWSFKGTFERSFAQVVDGRAQEANDVAWEETVEESEKMLGIGRC